MHKICFTISLFHASTCFEQHVLIVRRSKLYYTASGIITRFLLVTQRTAKVNTLWIFVVLLTVHLSIFILVINRLDEQNLFYNKFNSCLYMFRAPCAHRQEVKIELYSLWYPHTYRWLSRAQVERVLSQQSEQSVHTSSYPTNCTTGVAAPTCFGCKPQL